ncbi:MAG: glycosyltransferase family 4 protein [Proteobacteria bacterium]|nr:glycosyltransferase family 4 protein [Pseudomonadota bacterium]
MKIAIEAEYISPGGTGVHRYARSLIRSYLALPEAYEIVSLSNSAIRQLSPSDITDISAHSTPTPPNALTRLKRNLIHPLFRHPTFFAAYSSLAAAKFRLNLSRTQSGLFHALNYMPHGTSAQLSAPVVPVVYDCSLARFPETHPVARHRAMQRLPSFLEKAPLIQTISEFSRNEIIDVYGVPKDRIEIIIPGISDIFSEPATSAPATLANLDLTTDQFFLCVGTLEPRKNLKTVLRAHRALPKRTRTSFPLVLVGASGWGDTSEFALTTEEQSDRSIRVAGYLSDGSIRDLYATCRAFLFPSLYEGYGLPVREALAAGAPVAISAAPVLQEAADGHARILPTDDFSAWAAYLGEAAETNAQRSRVPPPTWDRAAHELHALYRKVFKQI